MTGKEQKRLRLENDGELANLGALNDATDDQPIYCTRCGSPNPSDSRFCRKCGRSLEEQEAEMVGLPSREPRLADREDHDHYAGAGTKAKNERRAAERTRLEAEPSAPQSSQDTNRAVLSIMTMLCVAGMAITSFVTSGGDTAGTSIPLFIAWFLVEGIRNAGRHRHNLSPGLTLTSIFTVFVVTGMFITAVVVGGGSAAGATIPILLGWVLLEGIRSNT